MMDGPGESCEEGARDPRVKTMLQVADVDDGTIRWVNEDVVTNIVCTD